MQTGTIGALLQSSMSCVSVAATVPTVGERHAVTLCSANDIIVKVGCRERTRTHTLPRSRAQIHIHGHTHRLAHRRSVLHASPCLAFTPSRHPWLTPSPSQVGTVAQLDAVTESLATTVLAAHAVIDAAKNQDVTSITEPATVYMARLACDLRTCLLTCLLA